MYPNGFYSKELDWKDNERKADAVDGSSIQIKVCFGVLFSPEYLLTLLLIAFSQVQVLQHCKEQSEIKETE